MDNLFKIARFLKQKNTFQCKTDKKLIAATIKCQ